MSNLAHKKCVPCEGGAEPLPLSAARVLLRDLPGWELAGGKSIRKTWRMKDFMAAMRFIEKIAAVAEADNHHPDLHLTRYRDLAVELWTHAINGLSENDFILAAKIEELPKELKA